MADQTIQPVTGVQPPQQIPGQPPVPGQPSTDPFTNAAMQQGQIATQNVNDQTTANRANQTNPTGSSTWTMDPATGQWTQNVSLAGPQQDALTSQQNVQAGRSSAAEGMLPGAVDALGKPIDTSGFSDYFSFGAPGETNQQAQDAVWGQLSPMLDQRRKAMEAQLANQGITMGSEAWKNAMAQSGSDENNARLQSVMAGFNQGKSLNDQNIAYGNYRSGQRQSQLGEAQSLRAQPLMDINSLLAGQGVQNPTFGQYGQAGVAAPPNLLGAQQSKYNAVLDSQNASADSKTSLMNGLFGLGSAALGSNTGQDFLSSLFGLG